MAIKARGWVMRFTRSVSIVPPPRCVRVGVSGHRLSDRAFGSIPLWVRTDADLVPRQRIVRIAASCQRRGWRELYSSSESSHIVKRLTPCVTIIGTGGEEVAVALRAIYPNAVLVLVALGERKGDSDTARQGGSKDEAVQEDHCAPHPSRHFAGEGAQAVGLRTAAWKNGSHSQSAP